MASALILASASPQRKTLLSGLGLAFEVMPSDVNEHSHSERRDPAERSRLLAELKARDVAAKRPECWIIGCDTLVVSPDGVIFEKPGNAEEARRMIQAQSGRTSVVHSGLALVTPAGKSFTGISSSDVRFKALSPDEIDWWIGTGLWQDRSGSFQIDGPGQLMIQEIRGDWTGIVGLPVFLLGELMRKAGAPFLLK